VGGSGGGGEKNVKPLRDRKAYLRSKKGTGRRTNSLEGTTHFLALRLSAARSRPTPENGGEEKREKLKE